MEKNCLLISAYCKMKNGQANRKYYVVYGGVICSINLDTRLDFVKLRLKDCPVYAYEDLKKVIYGELKISDIKEITYKEYLNVYCGV